MTNKDKDDNEDESPIIDDENEESFWENLESKPEQIEITEQTHYYEVGPFIVHVIVDRTGDPIRTKCNCDSTSRVQERELIYLFSLDDPIEVGEADKELYYCIHEYAALSKFWKGLYDELEENGIKAEEIN